MRVLIDGRWTDSFLDYHRRLGEYLLETTVWKNLERLQGLYFERPKSLWMVWSYLWEIGLRQTIRKVLSRSPERYRNEKYVACGIAFVRESSGCTGLPNGQAVVFLAPCHPRLAERIVLPAELLKPVDASGLSFLPRQGLLLCDTELEGGTDAKRLVAVRPRLKPRFGKWPFRVGPPNAFDWTKYRLDQSLMFCIRHDAT